MNRQRHAMHSFAKVQMRILEFVVKILSRKNYVVRHNLWHINLDALFKDGKNKTSCIRIQSFWYIQLPF